MKPGTDATGTSDRCERPDAGKLWLPALVLSVLAILLRILVATHREGIEIDGITYVGNASAMARDWRAINVLHPPLYSLVLMPFLGLCLAGLLVALLRALQTGEPGWVCLVGILGGLATLARPEGMSYLVPVAALLAAAPLLVGASWNLRRALVSAAVAALEWLSVLLPYMALIHHQAGHWNWSGKLGVTLRWAESVGEERSQAVVEQVITETREEEMPQSLLQYLAAHPKEAARRILINVHLMDKYTLPGLLQSGGIALVFLGLLHLRWRLAPAPPEWFLAAALLPTAGFLFFVVESRYFIPLIPVLSIIAGVGLARVGRPAAASPPGRLSRSACPLLCIVVLSFVPWIFHPWLREDPAGVETAAGLWLRRTAGPGASFIGRYPVISYYAQAPGIPFARRSLEEALAEGRSAGARFLIVGSVRPPESRPDLLWLVGREGIRSDLEFAHLVEDRADHRVVIYRTAGAPAP